MVFQLNSQAGFELGLNYKYGALLTHRESIAEEIRGKYPSAIEIQVFKKYKLERDWQKYWEPAYFGLSLSIYDLDQPDILGNAFGLKAFFARDYLPNNKSQDLLFSVGTGFCLTPTIYDENNNPLNSLISRKVNLLMSIALDYRIHFDKHWSLLFGIGIDHFSNAATRFPNIGVNIPHAKAGITYRLNPQEQEASEYEWPEFKKSSYWFPILSFARKSAGQEFENNDWAYSLVLQYVHHYHPRHAVIGSVDYTYNNTIRKILDDRNANQSRIGLAAGWQLNFGKTDFFLQLGYYIYRPEEIDEPIYHRFGLKQQIYRRTYITASLKSHYFRADVWELGIALKI